LGQPVQLGDNELGLLLLKDCEGFRQLGPVISLALFSLSKLGNQVCGTTVYEVMHSGTLGLQGQAEIEDRIEAKNPA